MDLDFSGEIFYWRGPAPFYFVAVPDEPSAAIGAASPMLSYGWGCIPVAARVGATRFTTALIPKDGRYLVPLKVAVRRAEQLDDGETVTIRLTLDV